MNRALMPVRAVAGGVGAALVAMSWPQAWTVVGWAGLVLGLHLVLAAALADRWPAVGRWVAAMLTGYGPLWFWHLNYAGLVSLPPATLFPLVILTALLLAVTLKAASGPWLGAVLGQLRGPGGVLFAVLVVYATARWFTRAELAGSAPNVFRGFYPLLAYPLGALALTAAARQVPGECVEAAREAWRRGLEGHERSVLAVVAVTVTALTALVAYRAVGPLPHVEDGIAYLYQAKTFLAGGLRQPAPPVPGAFDGTPFWVFADDHGYSYGIFPPGWPLILAAGVAVGAGWLVNPLLCGVAALLLYALVRASDDRATAGWSVLLLAASPFFVIMGASYLAHTATLVWILTAMLGAVRLGRGGGWADALLVGLGTGMTFATRYAEGMLLGVALGGYLVWLAARRRVAWRWSAIVLLGLAPGLSLALADNAVKTGSPFLTPVERWYIVHQGAPINRPGFGPEVGLEWDHSLGPGHTPLEGLWNTNANLFELNRYGLGWACGSLALALLFAVFGSKTAADRLQIVYALLIVGVYTAYWYHGIAFGPRFLHPLLIPLVVFTVKGARLVAGWLAGERGPERVRTGLVALAGCGVLTAWLAFAPLELMTTYHNSRGRDASERRVVAMARAAAGGRPCIVVQHIVLAGPGRLVPDYAVGFSLNPPGFEGDVLIARELDSEGRPQLAAIRAAYPDRVVLMWYKEEGRPMRLEPVRAAGGVAADRER